MPRPSTSPHAKAAAALRAHALAFPEAQEEFPWGDRVAKVRGKIFVFLGSPGAEGWSVSVKLPLSFEMALTLPFTAPTGYGLGRARWVTARFGPDDAPPLDLLRGWVGQSYRAVAPKRLVAALVAATAATASPAKTRAGRRRPRA